MPLNDRQIRNAKPAEKPFKLNDGSGLYLQITPAGGKLWRFDYYAIDRRRKTLSIGKYPAVSLLEVREAAENACRMIAAGEDSAVAKQQARRERKAAAASSFENIAQEWYKRRLPSWNAGHAVKIWRSLEADAGMKVPVG